jgi:hypothetical protein
MPNWPLGRRAGAWLFIAGRCRASDQGFAAGTNGFAEDKSNSREVSLARQDPAYSYPVDGRFYKADGKNV